MNLSLNQKVLFILVFGLAVSLFFFACSSPAAQLSSPVNEPAVPTTPVAAPSDNSSTLAQVNLPARVDVVYFHRPQRCPSCLCFEERVRYVVSTYFQNDIDQGNMTFSVYDIGDSQNTSIVNKYGAVGSQLFINTFQNGKDDIKDIQEIWDWNCRSDKPGFDQQVKNAIQQSLGGLE